ncbi:hypothetical protein [Brevibacillus choshinensis]|uniref:hypothetical protein n=1 Tax=Brevibacillus choshinensis TaxID=54911 RepID=UPI002E2401B2|nr:hypothetical protein [Brevibacillus choshinensis]
MEQNELIMDWFLWHQAVEYVKQDLPDVESADLRFPLIAGWVLRRIGSQVFLKEKEAAQKLKENRIRIAKEKFDQGEYFVVWSQRGDTDIFRIQEGRLRTEVQKKMEDIIKIMTEVK